MADHLGEPLLPFDEETWYDEMVEESKAVQALYDENGELRPLTKAEEARARAIDERINFIANRRRSESEQRETGS